MLFNSYEFILLFLPVTLALYYFLARRSSAAAKGFLIFASLCFYSYWDIANLPVLLTSIAVNYFLALRILRGRGHARKAWLWAGVVFDLAFLGWFKYAGFAAETAGVLAGTEISAPDVALPLGISFFTFTQLAYLVDAYRGETAGYTKSDYLLFVTIFPHLIAGPILYHKDMIPQFRRAENFRLHYENLNLGLFWFTLGLFKKVIIADKLAQYVNHSYAYMECLTAPDAWLASFAYTFQLYFDFSGYSEMAIGLGLLLNFRLPLNFNAPYRATSIIDFWRRWHMTLSAFLKNYLYIPLGGNRTGHHLRNISATMLLAGLWHGAGWTYVCWGGMHGLFICFNHIWRRTRLTLPHWLCWLLTLNAVNLAWIFFRAENFDQAFTMLGLMTGILPGFDGAGYFGMNKIATVAGAGALCFLPTVGQMAERFRPDMKWLAALLLIFLYALYKCSGATEFLYFQF